MLGGSWADERRDPFDLAKYVRMIFRVELGPRRFEAIDPRENRPEDEKHQDQDGESGSEHERTWRGVGSMTIHTLFR